MTDHDGPGVLTDGAEFPKGYFEWVEVLEVAGARKVITARQMAVASFVARTGDGATGQNACVTEAVLARMETEFGISRATIWRTFTKLCEAGWFTQTRKPRRGSAERPGESALYRVSFPRLDLRLGSATGNRVSSGAEDLRREEGTEPPIVSHFDADRVALLVGSCLTPTLEVETHPTCELPTCELPSPASVDLSTTERAGEDDAVALRGAALARAHLSAAGAGR